MNATQLAQQIYSHQQDLVHHNHGDPEYKSALNRLDELWVKAETQGLTEKVINKLTEIEDGMSEV